MRPLLLVFAALILALLAVGGARQAPGAPAERVTVGTLTLDAVAIAKEARPGEPLPVAAGRLIERAWLEREAARRRVPVAGVADALAGPRATSIPTAFERFHRRHRAATRCSAGFHDPHADRCANRAAAPAGTCRWMGVASLCTVRAGRRRVFVVLSPGQRPVRTRDRPRAVRLVRRALLRRRERRIAADPRIGPATARAAGRACGRHRKRTEPYAFGLGLQDPGPQTRALLRARGRLRADLRAAAAEGPDRVRLRGLLRAMRAGDAALRRIPDAARAGGTRRLHATLRRVEQLTAREARLAARAGLPRGCARVYARLPRP